MAVRLAIRDCSEVSVGRSEYRYSCIYAEL